MERPARGPSENTAELRLFGALDVVEHGVVRPFAAGRKAPQVLAYLALAHARSVTREQLAGILWPDCDERTARGYLRRSLYELSIARLPRREPWIAVRGESLGWNHACDVSVDVARFERAATPGEMADSIGWYRGDLLDGWYDDWVVARREELRRTLLGRLSELVRRRTREGDVRGALSFAERLLRVEPFDEETVRAAMALQRQIGDRAGALGRYESFRDALRREMQIDPMPETQALQQRIRSDEALAVPAPRPAGGIPRGRAPLVPFVVREAALAQLADDWTRTLDARGGVTFVAGEAGVGKSRLAAEFAAAVEARGATVLWGATGHSEQRPYEALASALAAAAPLVRDAGIAQPVLDALAGLVPELGGVANAAPALADASEERRRFFAAAAHVFMRASEVRPTLVVLEDVHWAGAATAELLESLALALCAHRMRFLVTLRDDEAKPGHPIDALRGRLDARGFVSTLTLDRFAPSDAHALDERLAPAFGAGAVRWAFERSEGLPLFFTELLRDGAGRGGPEQDGPEHDGAGHNGSEASSADLIVNARVARLPDDARRFVDVAAALEGPHSIAVARSTLGWNEARTARALAALTDAGFLRELDVPGAGRYGFAHDLIREAVARRTDTAQRRRLHERIAETIEGEAGRDRAAALAHHWIAAERPERAAGWLVRAAQNALLTYAGAEAAALASEALALASDDDVRVAALEIRSRAYERQSEYRLEGDDLEAMIALAKSMGDRRLLLTTLVRAIDHAERGDPASLPAAATRLEAELREGDNALYAAHVERARARFDVAQGNGEYPELSERARLLAERFEAAGDPAEAGRCRLLAAEALAICGRVAQAGALIAECERAETLRGDDAALTRVLVAAVRLANEEGYLSGSRPCDRLYKHARRIGDRRNEGIALMHQGLVLLNEWRLGDAQAKLEEATHVLRASEAARALRACELNLAAVWALGGRAVEARAHLAMLRADGAESGGPEFAAYLPIVAAAASLSVGDFERVLGEAEEARRIADAAGIESLTAVSESLIGVSRSSLFRDGSGAERLESALRFFEREGLTRQRTMALGFLARAYARDGEPARAVAAATELLAVVDAGGAFDDPAAGLYFASLAFRTAGEMLRARELLLAAKAALDDRLAIVGSGFVRPHVEMWWARELLAALASEPRDAALEPLHAREPGARFTKLGA